MTHPNIEVVAVVGTIASGKTTAAKYIASKDYEHHRLSEAIYNEVDKRGLDRKSRKDLQDVGDDMRREDGPSVLADRVITKINQSTNTKFVVDSIRNHHEVMALKQAFGDNLTVISIDAPVKDRYQRVIARQDQYDEQQSFKEFLAVDQRDRGEGNQENEQNVTKCMELADVEIENLGSEGALRQQLDSLI